jgi:hypothetical protein
MRIEIEKSGDTYRADCKDLPGMPPVGEGGTKEEAVASLFYRLLFCSADGTQWTRFIKSNTFEITERTV